MKYVFMRWVDHAAHMKEKGNMYKIVVEKSKGREQLGRPRRRWQGNN